MCIYFFGFTQSVNTLQATNISKDEARAIGASMKDLEYTLPRQSASGAMPAQLALTMGCEAASQASKAAAEPMTEMAWQQVLGIIEKLKSVVKAGNTRYAELSAVPATAKSSQLLREMEDSINALEDEQVTLVRLERFKKHKDLQCKPITNMLMDNNVVER